MPGIMKEKDKILLNKIGRILKAKKQTVSVAESVTAGYLQWLFSQVPDAALFFQGGLTAYNLGQKYKHLDVEPLHAKEVNCVSQRVALQMAIHVTKHFGSDWGLSITGYATPVPESGNKLFAYYAIAYKGKIKLKGLIRSKEIRPEQLQIYYSLHVLNRLESLL